MKWLKKLLYELFEKPQEKWNSYTDKELSLIDNRNKHNRDNSVPVLHDV